MGQPIALYGSSIVSWYSDSNSISDCVFLDFIFPHILTRWPLAGRWCLTAVAWISVLRTCVSGRSAPQNTTFPDYTLDTIMGHPVSKPTAIMNLRHTFVAPVAHGMPTVTMEREEITFSYVDREEVGEPKLLYITLLFSCFFLRNLYG